MSKFLFPVFAMALIISGCVTSQERQARMDLFRSTIPVCDGEADCKEKWSAAQVYIANNAGLKIQVLSDAIIETYNPGKNSSLLAAQVTKVPLGGGKYQIEIKTWCNNPFGCTPKAWDVALGFNEYVGRQR
jgi:hypothetical protein